MRLINIMHANGSISQAQYDQLKAAAGDDNSQMSQPGTAPDGQQARNLRSSNQELESEVQNNQAFRKEMDDKLATMEWASKIKLKSDIRLRYQYGDNNTRRNDAGNRVNRNRGPVRYRLGVITKPMTDLEVGAGLASGGSDPRSTNQTFGGDFSSKGIQLDYAYAQYKFNDNAVPDVFPDSDRTGGATDMKGHEVAGSYALNDVVELGLDYYNTQRKSINEDEQIVQADVSVKF